MAKMNAGIKGWIVKLFKAGTPMEVIKATVKPSFLKITATAILQVVKRHLLDECDRLWSLVIRQVGVCEICGKPGRLEAHHLIARQNYCFRWDISNGICLCTTHHQFGNEICAHGSNDVTSKFADWMVLHRPGQWAWFLKHRDDVYVTTCKSVTPDELLTICDDLTAMLQSNVKPDIGARQKVE